MKLRDVDADDGGDGEGFVGLKSGGAESQASGVAAVGGGRNGEEGGRGGRSQVRGYAPSRERSRGTERSGFFPTSRKGVGY